MNNKKQKCLNSFNQYYLNQFNNLVIECRQRNNTNLLNNYRRVCTSILKYPFPILTTQQALTIDGIGEATSRIFNKFIISFKKKIKEENINFIDLAYRIDDRKNSKKGNKKKAEIECGTDSKNKIFIKKKPLKNIELYSENWTAVLSLYLLYLQNDNNINIDFNESLQMAESLIDELDRKNIKIKKCNLNNIKELKNYGIVDFIVEKNKGTKIKINEFLIRMAELEIKKNNIIIDVDDGGTLTIQIIKNKEFTNNEINNFDDLIDNENLDKLSNNYKIKTNDLNMIYSQKNINLANNNKIETNSSNIKNIVNHQNMNLFNSDNKINNLNNSSLGNFHIKNFNSNLTSNFKENFITDSEKIEIKSVKNINDKENNKLIDDLNYIYETCGLDYNDFDFNSDNSSNYEYNYSQEFKSKSKNINNIESKYSNFYGNINLNCIIEDSESKYNISHLYCDNSEDKIPRVSNFDKDFKKNYDNLNKIIESSKKNSNVIDLSSLKKENNKRNINNCLEYPSDANIDTIKTFENNVTLSNEEKFSLSKEEKEKKFNNINQEKFNSSNFINNMKHSYSIRDEFKKSFNLLNNNELNISSISKNSYFDLNEKVEKLTEETHRYYRKFIKSIKENSEDITLINATINNNIQEDEVFEMFSINIKILIDNRERGPKGEKLTDEIRCLNPNINCEERVLSVGDFLWIYSDPNTETEYTLDFIIERKTLGDLASSIRDGRYIEQKHRLKNTKIKNVFYLFEGTNFNSAYCNVSKAAVFTAILNTINIHDISIIKTSTFDDSLKYIEKMDRFIKNFYFINKEKINLFEMITFQDFMIKNAKTKNLTEENIFLKQLRCVFKFFKFFIYVNYDFLSLMIVVLRVSIY